MLKRCQLHVELNRPQELHRAGEPLEGTVVVVVTSDCDLNHLTVTLQWRTHGKGNEAKGPALSQTLTGGLNWRAGETHRIPFRFETPRGPVSYHGHIINVDWYLSAHADVPWAIDSKAETEVFVGHNPALDWNVGFQHHAEPVPHSPAALLKTVKIPPPVVALIFGGILGLLVLGWWPLVDDDGVVWFRVLGFAATAVPAALFGFKVFRNIIAKAKIGHVNVSAPTQVSPGSTFDVGVAMQPPRPTTINHVHVELVGREIAVSGSGTNTTTHRHKLYEVTSDALTQPHRVTPQQPLQVSAKLVIPPNASPSFRATSNSVAWTVIVHVDIPNWPDLCEEHEIIVPPH